MSPTGLSAAEAARRLGVTRDTLYAYVSRGLVRSEARDGSRSRRYNPEDIAALVERKRHRGDPSRTAERALHFGAPILESKLSQIADGRLFYRGRDALELARSARFEAVVALLWTGDEAAELPDDVPELPRSHPARRLARTLPIVEGFQVVLAAASAEDPGAFDRSPAGVRRTGVRILRALAAVAADVAPSVRSIADVLAGAWVPDRPGARDALETALVLWADHELNVGTFTVRCAASAQTSPYAAVVAGLSALRGAHHGGMTEQVEALLCGLDRRRPVREVLAARLRRGEPVPGFGQPLYPDGDPRGRLLLECARAIGGRSRAAQEVEALAREGEAITGRAPNVDFATAALCHVLGLPEGTGLCLVAVARTAGWLAHILEQNTEGRLIRPRARYTGVPAEE